MAADDIISEAGCCVLRVMEALLEAVRAKPKCYVAVGDCAEDSCCPAANLSEVAGILAEALGLLNQGAKLALDQERAKRLVRELMRLAQDKERGLVCDGGWLIENMERLANITIRLAMIVACNRDALGIGRQKAAEAAGAATRELDNQVEACVVMVHCLRRCLGTFSCQKRQILRNAGGCPIRRILRRLSVKIGPVDDFLQELTRLEMSVVSTA